LSDLQNGGLLILGGSDSNYYKGQLNYVNLTEETAWIFNMDKVSIDDLVVCTDCSAFADTGILIFYNIFVLFQF
jgi:cathepsin D